MVPWKDDSFGEDDATRFLAALKDVAGEFDQEAETLTVSADSLSPEDLPKLADAFDILYKSEAVSRSPYGPCALILSSW
jgi:hypothetical protein